MGNWRSDKVPVIVFFFKTRSYSKGGGSFRIKAALALMTEELEEDWELPKRPPFSFYDEAVRDEEMIFASPPFGSIKLPPFEIDDRPLIPPENSCV